MMERIDKRLADCGRWSRKEARALVKAGRVSCDGLVLRDPGDKLPDDALIYVDGTAIQTEPFLYLMLHKPGGVVSSTADPREKTVLDLLPEAYRGRDLFPVGRLDKDTEGLLLLCNDGPLAHHLLSPRHHVEKEYFVRVEGSLDETDVAAFAAGICLRDGTQCQPARLLLQAEKDCAHVILQEGKYHQVKRMMAARGKPVCSLKRLRMGSLMLDETLPLGGVRPLTQQECKALQQLDFQKNSAY